MLSASLYSAIQRCLIGHEKTPAEAGALRSLLSESLVSADLLLEDADDASQTLEDLGEAAQELAQLLKDRKDVSHNSILLLRDWGRQTCWAQKIFFGSDAPFRPSGEYTSVSKKRHNP